MKRIIVVLFLIFGFVAITSCDKLSNSTSNNVSKSIIGFWGSGGANSEEHVYILHFKENGIVISYRACVTEEYSGNWHEAEYAKQQGMKIPGLSRYYYYYQQSGTYSIGDGKIRIESFYVGGDYLLIDLPCLRVEGEGTTYEKIQ